MIKTCFICNKGVMAGKALSRKGLIKKKGGTGSKVCRRNKRDFLPNLQKMRIVSEGHPKQVYLCTRCIKKGSFLRVVNPHKKYLLLPK